MQEKNLSPYDLTTPLLSQICIRLRKGSRTKKSVMCREWTRMRRSDDMMFARIDERPLRYSIVAPEDEYDTVSSIRE